MASRREYSMMFQLAAELSGSFKGTFSQAQKHLAAMQKELQALNKAQGDISAYQKQQKALEATYQKAQILQQQYDNIQREIRETEGYSSKLENALLSKQQQMDKNQAAIERQTAKLNQLGDALREAGINTEDLAGESQRLATEMEELKAAQEEAAEGAENFGKESVSSFEAAKEALVAAGLVEGLKELAEGYMECVALAGDFEASMSNVKALSGASGSEMEELSAVAKELGASTVFTAKEAADAMGYMAMAGWDAADMLGGIDGVLQLAAASGEDLAMVSDIVTDSLSAFGLQAEDTAHFSDVLAAAATSSNTNVAIMGETFKNSAAVAGALGYSIEDVAVAVGLMANSGIKGSRAGTALKNTFNGLLEGVTLTSAAFGEYDYTAVKADGTMKNFGDTVNELRGYFEQMTEAERVSNAMAIAGQEGYNGLLSILNATNADYEKLTASIYNCAGAAERMAAVKLDNLNGDLEELNSAWEGLQLTLGEQFTPELRDLYGVGADLIGLIDEFIQAHPGLTKGLMTTVAALGALVTGVTAVSAAIKVFKALNVAALFTGPAAAVLGLGTAFAALTGLMVGVSTAAKESLDESWELTAASKEQHDQIQALNAEYEIAKNLYGESSDEARALEAEIRSLTAAYESEKTMLADYVAEHNALLDSYQNMVDAHKTASNGIEQEITGTSSLINKLMELSSSSASVAENQGAIAAIIGELNEAIPGLGLSYEGLTQNSDAFVANLRRAADAQAEQLRLAEQWAEYTDRASLDYGLEIAKDDAAEQVRLATEQYEAALNAYNAGPSRSRGGETFNNFVGSSGEAAAVDAARANLDAMIAVAEEATAAYEENKAAMAELEEAYRAYSDTTSDAVDNSEALHTVLSNTAAEIEELATAYELVYTAAHESISGQYAIWDQAAKEIPVKAAALTSAMEGQIEYWQEYNENLQLLADRGSAIEGLSDMISSFADGSAESVNAIAGMAAASDEELRGMVATWKRLQEEQDATSAGIADLATNFTSEMDRIQTELAADVEGMNLSEEALASGQATIEAYLSAVDSMLPQVSAAYQRIAEEAARALGSAPLPSVPITKPGAVNRGYAEGTTNAARGWAWVGEQGPELMYMGGGEVVLPSNVSEAVTNSAPTSTSSGPSAVQITFQIGGDVTSEAVDRLRAYGGEIEEKIRQVLMEVNEDMSRRAYAL